MEDGGSEAFDALFDESAEAKIGSAEEQTADLGAQPLACARETTDTGDAHSEPFGRNLTFDEKSLEEKMNDLYNEFKADTTITLSNIREVAFRTAAIKGRWCSRLMAERVRGRRLKETLDTLVAELGKIVDTKSAQTSYLAAKQSRDTVINSNKDVRKLKNDIYESKQLQDYLAMIYESVGDLGYVVKNSLQALELERGI